MPLIGSLFVQPPEFVHRETFRRLTHAYSPETETKQRHQYTSVNVAMVLRFIAPALFDYFRHSFDHL